MKYLKNIRIVKIVFSCVSFILMLSCSNSTDSDPFVSGELPGKLYDVEASYIRSINYFPDMTPKIIYDVSVYKLEYLTTHNGTDLLVSGVVVVPDGVDDPPIIVDCHGTLQGTDDAPSMSTAQKPLRFTQMASAGYIVFAPDYIGFGVSANSFHPWLIAEPAAQTVVDMIKAGIQNLEKYKISYSDEIYLTGFSEGANFVLAAHKKIELNPQLGINLIASAPAAGAYDMEMTFTRRINGNRADQAVAVAYLVLTFKNVYKWFNPLTDFFRDKYISDFTNILQMSGSFVDNFFNTENLILEEYLTGNLTPQGLLNEKFRNLNSEARIKFITGLQENTVYSWKPEVPITLYYGKSDTSTYFENSITAFNNFKANGASPEIVKLVGFDEKDHDGTVGPAMRAALDWFEVLKD